MDGNEVGGKDVSEGCSSVSINTQSARMAAEKVVVEIRKQWYFISVRFLFLDIWN